MSVLSHLGEFYTRLIKVMHGFGYGMSYQSSMLIYGRYEARGGIFYPVHIVIMKSLYMIIIKI